MADDQNRTFAQALQLQQAGRGDDAARLYRDLIAREPGHAAALTQLAILHCQRGELEDGLRLLEASLAVEPRQPMALNGKTFVLYMLRRYEEAARCSEALIALAPGFSDAHNGRGLAFYKLRQFEEALASFDRALVLEPTHAEALSNRAMTLVELRRFEEALEACDRSLGLAPASAATHIHRGAALQRLRRQDEAIGAYELSLALAPGQIEVIGPLLHAKLEACDWRGLDALAAHAKALTDDGILAFAPFTSLVLPFAPPDQLKVAKLFVAQECAASRGSAWRARGGGGQKIRIGYFSSDFQKHATAYLLAELIELHDRNQFEIIGISFANAPADAMRARLARGFDRFLDLGGKSTDDIITAARALDLDIAVDLKGFSEESRIEIFAPRVAPVQVNFLGYPGTMGADFIDYIVADPIVIPEADKTCFSEKIAYLPESYQPNDRKRAIAPRTFTRAAQGLPEGGFVFCCFNNSYKINAEVFDVWMRLLRAVDDSVLWLLETNAAVAANLRKEAQARGVTGERLVFAPRRDLADHLARHACADLFLDTFSCNAHTTASDALWAGLPVLTRTGDAFAARVAASLLTAIGLPELITQTNEEYEQRALALAGDRKALETLKVKLAAHRLTHPLFDTPRFARHLEAAYSEMHRRRLAGLPPDHIRVPSA